MGNGVQGLIGNSMDKVKEMVDVNTVVGQPITVDGVTLIPVSKVAYGFAGGGADLPVKTPGEKFGGGSGAGINITPIAFLAISKGEVQVLPMVAKPDSNDSAISMIPDLVDKVAAAFSKKKDGKTDEKPPAD